MNLSRRRFLSAVLFARPTQKTSFEAAVLESFDIDGRTVAVLANHADASARQDFAMRLRANPKATVRVRTPSGDQTTAFIFRVGRCFGRALIVLHEPVQIRKEHRLLVEWSRNGA
jgi:hypothetical protein